MAASTTDRTSNPIGVHALVWVGDTTRADIDTVVAAAGSSGYDLLELSLHNSVDLDVEYTAKALAAAGLEVACSRGLAFDADVSSDDPAIVERGEKLLHESLRITRELGGTTLTGALYSALGKYGAPLTAQGRANVVRVLQGLATEAASHGMQLGLEICNRYETNVVNTVRDALDLADDIGHDNVGVHLDTYHMNIEEADLVRPVHEAGDRLAYVHIGENHRGYLGAGHIDFGSFFGALVDVEYRGPITFESFSSAVVSERLTGDLAIWRNMWDDGTDLAVHARTFIENGMAAARRRR